MLLRARAQRKVLGGVVLYLSKGSRARPDGWLARCVSASRKQGSDVMVLLSEVIDRCVAF
jgi:hypothetical protein